MGYYHYMHGVSQSIVANFIWYLFFIILALYLWSLEHGPFETLKSIMDKSRI
jgi:nitrogen fixation-related uncharacterized protein